VLLVTAGSRGASDVNLFRQLGARQTSSSSMLVGELDAEQRPHQPRFAFGAGVQFDGGRDQIDFAGPFGHRQLVIGSASSDEVLFNSTGQVGNLAAGEQLAELFILAGGTMARPSLDAVAGRGRLDVRHVSVAAHRGSSLPTSRTQVPR
jgi:hypothetical protein